jgi:hypothetical protein
MGKMLGRLVRLLLALSLLGVGLALGGLATGNDAVYWAGLLLAAPLYLGYVLPMVVFLFGVLVVAFVATITDRPDGGR